MLNTYLLLYYYYLTVTLHYLLLFSCHIEARGVADRGVESLRFQVNIVRR